MGRVECWLVRVLYVWVRVEVERFLVNEVWGLLAGDLCGLLGVV